MTTSLTVTTGTVTLTGGVTAKSTSGSGSASSADFKRVGGSGQYYFEVTVNTAVSTNTSAGIAKVGAGYTTNASGMVSCYVDFSSGTIYSNGSSSGSTVGATLTTNDVLCVAVDITKNLIWFRKNAGNWNNSATANPATGVGGIAIPALGYVAPACTLGATNEQLTFNFGGTAYAQSVPSGFANWPSPGDSTAAMVTASWLEVMQTDASNARVSATWLEVYTTSSSSFTTAAFVTSEVLEVFASTAAGGSTITPALFSDTDTFYSPEIISAFLSPSLVDDSLNDTFYSPTLSASDTLSPSLITDTDTFYSPTFSYTNTLVPDLFSDSDVFYSPTLSSIATLLPGLFSDSDLFYSPTVVGQDGLAPSLFQDSDTFYSPSVTSRAAIAPNLFSDTDLFWSPLIAITQQINDALFQDTDTFYSPLISQTAQLMPSLYLDSDIFYSPIEASGISPNLFADPDSFYSPDLLYNITLLPPLVQDQDTFWTTFIALQQKSGGGGSGGGGGGLPGNLKYASSITMPGAGLITTLEVQSTTAGAVNTRMGLYSNQTGNKPNALLGQTDAQSSVSIGANDYPLQVPVAVLSGQIIWVALQADGTFSWFLANQSQGSKFNTDLFIDGLSNPFGSSSNDNKQAPVFVIFLAAGNASVSPSFFSDLDVFYSPITAALNSATDTAFTDNDVIPTTTLSASNLIQPEVGNVPVDDTFYSPTITTFNSIVAVFVDDTPNDSALTPFVDNVTFPGRQLGSALFSADDVIYSPTITLKGGVLSPALIDDSTNDTFLTPQISTPYSLSPNLVDDTPNDSIYALSVAASYVLSPSFVADIDQLGVQEATLGGDQFILPPLYDDSSEQIFSPSIGFQPIVGATDLLGDDTQRVDGESVISTDTSTQSLVSTDTRTSSLTSTENSTAGLISMETKDVELEGTV